MYDVNVTENSKSAEGGSHHETGHMERAFQAFTEDYEPELDQEFMDTMLAQDDADALTVRNFEVEFEEFLQESQRCSRR